MIGGYQVIDFKGESLTSNTTIKGAFKKAKAGRPILVENIGGVSGFTYDATPTSTTTATIPVTVWSSSTFKVGKLTISNEDVCKLTVS